VSAVTRPETLHVRVNGTARELPPGTTIEALVASDARGIAVALNREVVPRHRWSVVFLTEGDEVELVRAVQGG